VKFLSELRRFCFLGGEANKIFLLMLYNCFYFMLRANKHTYFVFYDNYIMFLVIFSCSRAFMSLQYFTLGYFCPRSVG